MIGSSRHQADLEVARADATAARLEKAALARELANLQTGAGEPGVPATVGSSNPSDVSFRCHLQEPRRLGLRRRRLPG
jgi:hypothetical protein